MEIIKTQETENKDLQKKQKVRTGIMISLVLLLIGIVVFSIALWISRSGKGTGTQEDESDFFPFFIPVWIAIFVPMIARKNRKASLNQRERNVLLGVVGVTILFLFITLLAWKLNT